MVDKKKPQREDIEEELLSEDISPADEIEITDIEEHEEAALKKLKQKLKACEKEKVQYLEDLGRAKADFLNSKRRLEEQALRDRERATLRMIEHMLPLADSFDMAMSHTEAWEKADETWRAGIEGIHAQLLSIFKTNNVTTIEEMGVPFNPHIHEAVSEIPATTEEEVGTVMAIVQKGYSRGEDVIRPARVMVGTDSNN